MIASLAWTLCYAPAMAWGKEQRAMRTLAEWYARSSGSMAYQFIAARPAPMLVLNTSSFYWLFITARDGQFIAILDDKTAGSIPSEQILGPLTEQPSLLMRRAMDTALWYAKKNLADGAVSRGEWYLSTANHVASFLGFDDLTKAINELEWDLLVERSKTDPGGTAHKFGLWGQSFSKSGDWERAVQARVLAGDASERAFAAGDSHFEGEAKTQYRIALNYIPEGRGAQIGNEIRIRLSRLS
jgi:hypothetical protein